MELIIPPISKAVTYAVIRTRVLVLTRKCAFKTLAAAIDFMGLELLCVEVEKLHAILVIPY